MRLFIPILFSTSSEHRTSYGKVCANLVAKKTKERYDTRLINASRAGLSHTSRELNTPAKKKLSKLFSRADGFIIVSPEYNHGYPGELKMLLDSFYGEFNRKPVGIIGVSDGGIGGARMVEQLRLVAIALQMVPLNAVIHFSSVGKLFKTSGAFLAEGVYKKRFEKFFEELSWYAHALKKARRK